MHKQLLATAVVAALSMAGVASAATPPSLTGETFTPGTATTSTDCGPSGSATIVASGTASGPYSGTYTETLTFDYASNAMVDGTATFTITTADSTVTGTEQAAGGEVFCFADGGFTSKFETTYSATISTSAGQFHDEGTWGGFVVTEPNPAFIGGFGGTFTSTLPNGPIPLLPTSKDQCKKGGWQSFGVFKNQGDCVSFVATGGRNQPTS
ncbi:MAG TPA: hypothetical protein VIE38_01600 [Gaiellaceae bacterium]|jgi:hypothetical protein